MQDTLNPLQPHYLLTTAAISNRPMPKHESLHDGRYRWLPHEEEVNDDGILSIIRLRHDGGLRLGGRDEEDGIAVI